MMILVVYGFCMVVSLAFIIPCLVILHKRKKARENGGGAAAA
jgi:hypothetical protein